MLMIRPIPACYPSLVTLSSDQLFAIGHNENVLASWLQQYGPEIVSVPTFLCSCLIIPPPAFRFPPCDDCCAVWIGRLA